jgi:PAS domain S-box-containing protein
MRDSSYFATFCNTGDGVFILDANQHIIQWNKGAEKILKYSATEVLNQNCCRVISGRVPPDKILCCQNCKIHSNALKGVPQKNFDMLIRTNDGEPLWLNVSTFASVVGEERFVAHILRDITQAKKNGQALERFLTDLGYPHAASEAIPAERSMGRNLSATGIPAIERPAVTLSNREIEVLTLLAEGLSTKDLAQRLNISHFTARNHIQNILVKLDLHSKAQAVSYAFRAGIL